MKFHSNPLSSGVSEVEGLYLRSAVVWKGHLVLGYLELGINSITTCAQAEDRL